MLLLPPWLFVASAILEWWKWRRLMSWLNRNSFVTGFFNFIIQSSTPRLMLDSCQGLILQVRDWVVIRVMK